MKRLRNFGDSRQMAFCVYCGSRTESRDHVPSKVFLDKPYPCNLPVVPACQSCNESFSLDEEYSACLIECTLNGTTDVDELKREKIRQILKRKPALASRLRQARVEKSGKIMFDVETERVNKVILKLARGHAAFELNEPKLDNPAIVSFIPLTSISQESRRNFEKSPRFSVWPEVGSRAMQRVVINNPGVSLWIIVQQSRYRYLTSVDDGVIVRIVIGECLACEVIWS